MCWLSGQPPIAETSSSHVLLVFWHLPHAPALVIWFSNGCSSHLEGQGHLSCMHSDWHCYRIWSTIQSPFFELRVPVSQSEHTLLAVHSLSISTFLHPCRDYPELRMHASIHLPMCFLPRAFTCLLGFSICSLVHHQTHAAG